MEQITPLLLLMVQEKKPDAAKLISKWRGRRVLHAFSFLYLEIQLDG